MNFQKTVLLQAINYCLDRTSKDQHEQLYLKFQFWVLKVANKNISGEFNSPPIFPEEINQSIDVLCRLIMNNPESLNKCFILKTAYELGYYYYLTEDNEKMREYFSICLKGFSFDKADQNFNTVYFNREDIELILNFNDLNEDYENLTQSGIEDNIEMKEYDNLLDFTKETHIVENDFESFLNKLSIDDQSKVIIDVRIFFFGNILKFNNFLIPPKFFYFSPNFL